MVQSAPFETHANGFFMSFTTTFPSTRLLVTTAAAARWHASSSSGGSQSRLCCGAWQTGREPPSHTHTRLPLGDT